MCAATHDNSNNSLKPIEAESENKPAVQQLTKRIPSGNGNFTEKEIIPETILEAHQICSMQEMVVKYDWYLAHDFQINKKNGHSAKAIVGQNGQKMVFSGAELQSSKKNPKIDWRTKLYFF